jgi:EKC/KEOPS complex subunit CGI121/TPRKB
MALEKLHLEHVPPTYQVYTAFFRDVANTDFLHKQLLSRNTDFQYAFIDASSVISRLHLLSAVYSAVNALLDGTLRTPNVHSEMVVSFNINNNVRSLPISHHPPAHADPPQIADAYRRWGITPGKTKDLVVVKVVLPASATQDGTATQTQTHTEQTIWEHLMQHVQGTTAPLTDDNLAKATDWPKVRKYYRLNGVPALERAADEDERRSQSETLAIMGMALRGL